MFRPPTRELLETSSSGLMLRELFAMSRVGREPLEESVLVLRGKAQFAPSKPVDGFLFDRFCPFVVHDGSIRRAKNRAQRLMPAERCVSTVRSEIPNWVAI